MFSISNLLANLAVFIILFFGITGAIITVVLNKTKVKDANLS